MTSKSITNEPPLLLSPQLATILGSADAAIVLQQIHYWLSTESGRIINDIRWIYNRLDDWLEQFPWMSKWQLRKVFGILRDEFKVVIFAQHEAKEWKRRGWYTIDYEALESFLHTSTCEGTNSQELVERTLDVCGAHTSESETSSESSHRIQQQSAAAFLEKPVKEETSTQPPATLVDQTELVDDEPEMVDEDHFSEAPEPQKLDPDEYREILSEIRDSDISLSPELQRLVLKSSVGVVRDALAVVLKQLQLGKAVNPPGYLSSAIEGQWKPAVGFKEKSLKRKEKEVRFPTSSQIAFLEECFASGKIRHFYESDNYGTYMVVMLTGIVVEWWECIENFK